MPGSAPDDVLIGLNAKLYRNSNTYASPTWVEICIIGDVTLNLEKSEIPISMRCSTWELIKTALKKGSVDFKLFWIPGNASFQAVRDSFLNNSNIEFAVMDGDLTTASVTLTQGLRATMTVTKFTKGEPLDGAQTADITIKPTYSSSAVPAWYTVST